MGESAIWREIHVTASDRGNVNFQLYDNDGTTPRNGTGKTYTLRVWADPSTLKFSTALIADTPASGLYHWAISAGQIDDSNTTVATYRFKVFEDYGLSTQVGLEEGTLHVHPKGP